MFFERILYTSNVYGWMYLTKWKCEKVRLKSLQLINAQLSCSILFIEQLVDVEKKTKNIHEMFPQKGKQKLFFTFVFGCINQLCDLNTWYLKETRPASQSNSLKCEFQSL